MKVFSIWRQELMYTKLSMYTSFALDNEYFILYITRFMVNAGALLETCRRLEGLPVFSKIFWRMSRETFMHARYDYDTSDLVDRR